MTERQESPRFLTIKDVAVELATSESQVRALLSCGDLPAIQIGGRGYLKFLSRFVESTCS